MKRSREEFQGKSAVVTALSGIFSSENSYSRKVIILPAYGKNGGSCQKLEKQKEYCRQKQGKNGHKTVLKYVLITYKYTVKAV